VDDDDTTACVFAAAITIGIFQIYVDIPMGIDGFPSPFFRG
jgi:hypothetical protein